jgi:hypothetical protein
MIRVVITTCPVSTISSIPTPHNSTSILHIQHSLTALFTYYVKLMPKIHSIETNSDNIVRPAPPVDINVVIFEANDDKTLTNNALLCHDILRYGREQKYSSGGFRFSDLVNWLMRNNLEFMIIIVVIREKHHIVSD